MASLTVSQQNTEKKEWERTGDYFEAVSPESALLQLPNMIEENIPLDADHSRIVKFNARSDPGYSSTLDRLRQYVKDAPSVVASRFCT